MGEIHWSPLTPLPYTLHHCTLHASVPNPLSLSPLRQCTMEEELAMARGEPNPPGLLTQSQFRHVWRKFSVKVSREQSAALFLKHGCDGQGLLPYDVFAARLLGSQARLLALEPQQKVGVGWFGWCGACVQRLWGCVGAAVMCCMCCIWVAAAYG